jgi:hypothetical protein
MRGLWLFTNRAFVRPLWTMHIRRRVDRRRELVNDKKKPIDPELLRRLEAEARNIGNGIANGLKQRIGKPMGFALFIFNFDGSELTYISNSNREDMIRLIEETATHLRGEHGMPSASKN